jgi:hypothetical protein
VRTLLTQKITGPRIFEAVTISGKPATLASVQFLTREQAEVAMRGASLQGQVVPGGLVCYIVYDGPFYLTVSGPPASPGTPPLPPGAHGRPQQTVHLVIDAHTGNLLVFGAQP